MESPQSQFNQTSGALPPTLQEEDTLVDLNSPDNSVCVNFALYSAVLFTRVTPLLQWQYNALQGSPQPSIDSNSTSRRVTRSQTTGRPTVRWGKHGRGDPSDTSYRGSSASLKRSFDARAVDDETDVEADQDPAFVPSKLLKMEHTMLISEASSATIVEETPQPPKEPTPVFEPSDTPMPGEYTFLDASSSSFTSERRGPRIRTAPPIPVPNLTKKSRGRRVPTAVDDAAVEGEATEGRKGRVYVCKVEDCGKCFSRGEHLKRHIRSIHTHEKREYLGCIMLFPDIADNVRHDQHSTALTPRATNVLTATIIYSNICVSTRAITPLRPLLIQPMQLQLMIRLLVLTAHPPQQRLSVPPHLRQAQPAEQSAQLARLNRLRPRHQFILHVLQLRERQLEMHPLPFLAPTPFLHCPP
jgi:hypothetical protein